MAKKKDGKRRVGRMKKKGDFRPRKNGSKKGLDAPGVNDAEEQAKMKARKKNKTKPAKPPGTPTKSDQRTDKTSPETGKPSNQPPPSTQPQSRQPSMSQSGKPKKRGLFETFKIKAKAAVRAVKSKLGLSQPSSRKRGAGRWRIGLG